jgi:hypothetical protein
MPVCARAMLVRRRERARQATGDPRGRGRRCLGPSGAAAAALVTALVFAMVSALAAGFELLGLEL